MRHPLSPAAGLLALVLAAGCGSKQPPSPVVLSPEEREKLNAPTERVENPSYALWGPFPVGTTVTQTTTTDSPKSPGRTVTTIVYRLTERTDERVVVERQATTEYHDGRVDKNPPAADRVPRWVPLPAGVKRGEWGKATGKVEEEEVTVLGKAYKAHKAESKGSTDAGELHQTVWMSADMPGGLVRSVSRVPKVDETTTIEVTAVTIPD